MHSPSGDLPDTEIQWFEELVRLSRFLRSPEGCPWDRQQRAADFAGYAREEHDELIEAIASGDRADMAEEYGDVFFVLLATAAAAEEEGLFSLKEALAAAHAKMVRRHAHVFGETKAADADEAIDAWNRIKQEEKGR